MNVSLVRHPIIPSFELLGVLVGPTFVHRTPRNSNSAQKDVFFLAIVTLIKDSNVWIHRKVVSTSPVTSYLMRTFFPSLNSTQMLAHASGRKFYFFPNSFKILFPLGMQICMISMTLTPYLMQYQVLLALMVMQEKVRHVLVKNWWQVALISRACRAVISCASLAVAAGSALNPEQIRLTRTGQLQADQARAPYLVHSRKRHQQRTCVTWGMQTRLQPPDPLRRHLLRDHTTTLWPLQRLHQRITRSGDRIHLLLQPRLPCRRQLPSAL
jgi:hypothetical protein